MLMNVDPRIIADLMTEDPDQFNQPTQAQQPAPQAQQPAQPQAGSTNKRTAFMIQLVNMAERANVPETDAGYNQIGRSEGFIKHTTSNGPWDRLIANPRFQEMLTNISAELRKQIVTEIAKSVSRA